MRIALVEDSADFRSELENMLQGYCAESHISVEMEPFDCGEAFLAGFEKSKYDIIFLDVYMAGIDGLATARAVRQLDEECLIIFVSSSSSHAVDSYSVNAFYYLLKPITQESMREVMDRCLTRLYAHNLCIRVKERWAYIQVPLEDILYVDTYNHYVQLHLESRVVRSHIKFIEFSQQLLKHPRFCLCYRNCIINMDKVSGIDGKDFFLPSGIRIPIARQNSVQVRQQYADYMLFALGREK